MITQEQLKDLIEKCDEVYEAFKEFDGDRTSPEYLSRIKEIQQAAQDSNDALVKEKLTELKTWMSGLNSSYETGTRDNKYVDIGNGEYQEQLVNDSLPFINELLTELDNAIYEKDKYAPGYKEPEENPIFKEIKEIINSCEDDFQSYKAYYNHNNAKSPIKAKNLSQYLSAQEIRSEIQKNNGENLMEHLGSLSSKLFGMDNDYEKLTSSKERVEETGEIKRIDGQHLKNVQEARNSLGKLIEVIYQVKHGRSSDDVDYLFDIQPVQTIKSVDEDFLSSNENAEKLKQFCTASDSTLKGKEYVATGLFDEIEKDLKVYENRSTAIEVKNIRTTMTNIKGLFNKDPLDTGALAESLNTLKNQLEPLSRFKLTQYVNVREETTDSYGFSTGSNSVSRDVITELPTCKQVVKKGFRELLDNYSYIPGGVNVDELNQKVKANEELKGFKTVLHKYDPSHFGIKVNFLLHKRFKTELDNDINKAIDNLKVLSVDSLNNLRTDLEAVQAKLDGAKVDRLSGDIGPNDHKKFTALVNNMLKETDKKISVLNRSASNSPNANNNKNQRYGSGYPHLLSQPSSVGTEPGASPRSTKGIGNG